MTLENRPMRYELNTDEFYAYGHIYEPWAGMNTEIVLSESVEELRLMKAVNSAFLRMPYYKVRIGVEQEPERYILETNPLPFPIIREDDFMALSDERCRDYLISVTYTGRTIRIRVSHALCDAYGMNRFISFILCAYYGKESGIAARTSVSGQNMVAGVPADVLSEEDKSNSSVGLMISQEKIDEEYANPFDYIPDSGETNRTGSVSSFSFETEEVSDAHGSLTRISVPGDEFLSFAKKNESSVAAVGAWILMRTIKRVKRNVSKPVSVAIPCDMRSIIGCEGNMRNCNIDLTLTMHMKMVDKDDDYQLSCLRSQLFSNMYEPVAISKMRISKEGWLRASKITSMRERMNYYKTEVGLDEMPIVTYVGSLNVGKHENKIESVHQHIPILGKAGILMVISYHRGMIELNITSNLREWDRYLTALTSLLKEIGMPATILKNERGINENGFK